MSTHTFDLLFSWKPNDKLAPFDADAQIVLKPDATIYSHDDRVALTPKFARLRELEERVEFLHGELDEILRIGRRKFAERDTFRESA